MNKNPFAVFKRHEVRCYVRNFFPVNFLADCQEESFFAAKEHCNFVFSAECRARQNNFFLRLRRSRRLRLRLGRGGRNGRQDDFGRRRSGFWFFFSRERVADENWVSVCAEDERHAFGRFCRQIHHGQIFRGGRSFDGGRLFVQGNFFADGAVVSRPKNQQDDEAYAESRCPNFILLELVEFVLQNFFQSVRHILLRKFFRQFIIRPRTFQPRKLLKKMFTGC